MMKTLTTLLLVALTLPTLANPTDTLTEALRKLNRQERKLEDVKQGIAETKGLIRDALYDLQYQDEPKVSCSYKQSGRTITGTGSTKDEALRDLMRVCVGMNVNPGACELNIKYNAKCY
jgi:hypothetical protein